MTEIEKAIAAERERIAAWHDMVANRADRLSKDGIDMTGAAYEHRASAMVIRKGDARPENVTIPPKG
jgi:hypothetical protein